MPKSEKQKLKLLYLMRIFLNESDENHPLTVQDIISRLNAYGISAERKSIYDDIECLCQFGLDISHKKGKQNGYFVAYRDFELPELKLLVDAVQSSKFITYKKSEQLIKKLEGLTSRYEASELNRQVYAANRIKTMNESIYYNIDKLHTAIIHNSQITFKYFEWTLQKEKKLRHNGKLYNVSPWSLIWDDENYYLIAYDSEAQIIKHYRVDKMLDITLTEEHRLGKEVLSDFDSALYSSQMFSMFGGENVIVSLLCSNSLIGVIIDRFGKDIVLFKEDDDHFSINVKVSVSPPFLSWVFSFGEMMKITSPDYVVDKFKNLVKKVSEQYN